eukprot:s49_g61.t1
MEQMQLSCRWFLCLVLLQFPLAWASWSLLASDGPSARSTHAAAADLNQVLWVHAGKGEELLQDLWVYNQLLNTWTPVPLFSTAPSARKEHVAVTDSTGDLWIHGGQDDTAFLNDLWKLSANTWTLVSNGSVPSRSSHVGVWDSMNGALWIHGGFDGVLRQDIWKFEAEGSSWFSIDANDGPSARAHHVAALDVMNGVIWIHGGYDGGLLGDLWKFDTRTYAWNLISTGGPSARAHHVAVWDTLNHALWIHGGFDGMACQDLWRFEPLTYTWNIWNFAEDGPPARYDHAAAWDGTSLTILVHGGYDQGLQRDLWRFEVPVITSTSTETQTSTTSTQTTSTTTSSTTSTLLPSLETVGEGLPSDVLALILALSVLGVAMCLLAFYWYRKRQKSREAVVPVPPPLPPPLPPHDPPRHDPPPPSPKSPQLRVNMQVLVPPPSPQQALPKPEQSRTSAFPVHSPHGLPDVVPRFAFQPGLEPCNCTVNIAPDEPTPLMPEQVHVDIFLPTTQPPHSLQAVSTKVDLCKPKEPGRTEKAPELPDSAEHAMGHHPRRPMVSGRLDIPDPQPPAPESSGRPNCIDFEIAPESAGRPSHRHIEEEVETQAPEAVPERAELIDVVIEMPVSPPSQGEASTATSGLPGAKGRKPKVPSKTKKAPQLPATGPTGPGQSGQPAPRFGPPIRKAPDREAVEVAVVLPGKEHRTDTDMEPPVQSVQTCIQSFQPLDLQLLLDGIEGPKCPADNLTGLRLPISQRSLEVEVDIGRWPAPPQPPKPQPLQPLQPLHPAASELPWPHFRRRPAPSPPRLQRSQSAQTPRRWMQRANRPKPTIPRPKSVKGQDTSTLGGPWWKAYPQLPQWKPRSRGEWAVLNRNPGPGAYDLEHPRIQGRIPGRVPGFPHFPRDPNKRI